MTNPLRAIIADDSALFRAVLRRALLALGGVEVVAQVANGAEAVDQVRKLNPDLLTLDLNMPVLDGLGALRALRDNKLSCEVLMISSETRQGAATTIEALQLGAIDFITKPAEENSSVSTEVLANSLKRHLAAIRLRRDRRQNQDGQRGSLKIPTAPAVGLGPQPSCAATGKQPEVIAIGTSTGGPTALPVLLGALPANFPLPILVVQHMPPLFTASLAESLDKKCPLRIVEAHNGQLVEKGSVYIAPGGKHMQVKRTFEKSVRILLSDDPPENFCRPSVDYLFRSVAQEYGGRVTAAILTGMGNDGVAGLRLLKAAGAKVIAQNEATCTVFGMPQEAIRAGVVDCVLPLDRIASAILDSTRSNGY